MVGPLSTPCPVDAPPTNNVIAHTITQGEDDVCLLNDPVALFSHDYDENNCNGLTLTQSCPKNDILQKRKAAPRSPSPTAPSMMPSPMQKRQTQPVASSPTRTAIPVAYPLLPLRIVFTFLHQSIDVVLLYRPSSTRPSNFQLLPPLLLKKN